MTNVVESVKGITLLEGEVILYIDKYGELHATRDVNHAVEYSKPGYKFIVTDECGCTGGRPVINNEKVDVYGGGEGYAYLTKRKREQDIKYITLEGSLPGPVTVDRTKLPKALHKAYREASELYVKMLPKGKE